MKYIYINGQHDELSCFSCLRQSNFTHVICLLRNCSFLRTADSGPLKVKAATQTERSKSSPCRENYFMLQDFYVTRYLHEFWYRLLYKATLLSPKKLLRSDHYSV